VAAYFMPGAGHNDLVSVRAAKFSRVLLYWTMLVFLAVRSILRTFGIFYGHLVYIFPSSYVARWYNLATLVSVVLAPHSKNAIPNLHSSNSRLEKHIQTLSFDFYVFLFSHRRRRNLFFSQDFFNTTTWLNSRPNVCSLCAHTYIHRIE
jgi:hypothetical protein